MGHRLGGVSVTGLALFSVCWQRLTKKLCPPQGVEPPQAVAGLTPVVAVEPPQSVTGLTPVVTGQGKGIRRCWTGIGGSGRVGMTGRVGMGGRIGTPLGGHGDGAGWKPTGAPW